MLGAIIGDIVGSRFEFNNTNKTDFEFFAAGCDYTDYTICTIAVADTIVRDADFGETLQAWCRRYPHPKGAYGGSFVRWVQSRNPQPYGSYGNGSAMRVSPCGWLGVRSAVVTCAEQSAACTHNHPEGIKGACCVAECIAQARISKDKELIRQIATEKYGYDVSMTCDAIRATNRFDETCQVTVPQALSCFFESHDFESAVRLAVSIGGDSDTIAAITGSIAEAFYGIPTEIEEKALAYLPEEMKDVIRRFKAHIDKQN